MFKGVVKVLEEFEPACLSAINFVRLAEVLEVFMISSYTNGMFHSKKEGATTFKSKDNCSEFFVMCIVVALGREKTTGVESNGVNPIQEFLHEDSTEGVSGGVCFHNELLFPIRRTEHRICDAEFF